MNALLSTEVEFPAASRATIRTWWMPCVSRCSGSAILPVWATPRSGRPAADLATIGSPSSVVSSVIGVVSLRLARNVGESLPTTAGSLSSVSCGATSSTWIVRVSTDSLPAGSRATTCTATAPAFTSGVNAKVPSPATMRLLPPGQLASTIAPFSAVPVSSSVRLHPAAGTLSVSSGLTVSIVTGSETAKDDPKRPDGCPASWTRCTPSASLTPLSSSPLLVA